MDCKTFAHAIVRDSIEYVLFSEARMYYFVDNLRAPTVQTVIILTNSGIWKRQTKLELLFIVKRTNRLLKLSHELGISIKMLYLILWFHAVLSCGNALIDENSGKLYQIIQRQTSEKFTMRKQQQICVIYIAKLAMCNGWKWLYAFFRMEFVCNQILNEMRFLTAWKF